MADHIPCGNCWEHHADNIDCDPKQAQHRKDTEEKWRKEREARGIKETPWSQQPDTFPY